MSHHRILSIESKVSGLILLDSIVYSAKRKELSWCLFTRLWSKETCRELKSSELVLYAQTTD